MPSKSKIKESRAGSLKLKFIVDEKGTKAQLITSRGDEFRERHKVFSSKRITKKFTVEKAKDNFKRNKSLDDKTIYTPLVNVAEKLTSPSSARVGSRGAWFEVTLKFRKGGKNIKIYARSRAFYSNRDMNDAKAQAYEGAYAKLAESFGRGYDDDIGEKLAQKLNIQVEENIVTYKDL